MSSHMRVAMVVLAFGTTLAAVLVVRAQPAMGANGCCCVPSGGAFVCASKTQAECLAVQPAAPTYPKLADWQKDWDAAVAASKAQEAKPLHGGWIAEPCAKVEARPGCCCFPKLHPTATDKFDCKPSMTEFDCRAQCSMFKDGRLPSGCTWAVGGCQP
jgi:hypothetical protein